MESDLATEAEYYLHQNKITLSHFIRSFQSLSLFSINVQPVSPFPSLPHAGFIDSWLGLFTDQGYIIFSKIELIIDKERGYESFPLFFRFIISDFSIC